MTNNESPRINFAKAASKVFKAQIAFEAASMDGIDPDLAELIKIRASQLNNCAYCLHMHTTDARKAGWSDDKMHMVGVWREARNFFDEKEIAVLELTEAVTLLSHGGVSDEVYANAAKHLDETELGLVLGAICAINTWNRIAVSTAKIAGADERA
ncbi:AhpD family alkylhydroperoxidase [Herbihabitans rhizosphaerae]|uniref:AhpD family alkylhydroperoxidase n=1 Tax=Herbihabitans rhizosphaerae TaxID=1872711 RepID=A0A4Q7KIT8_9PSEU|nr:carboxymuconolactone decarboxylase family protein [Herbihabitans rhizosphaerae]RZS32828.1 AhpD family alkylhydroperoxidase [Herbihabitans rhizosphaerae]